MRRLFLPGKLADTVTLTGSDAHHLGYTLRARVGERCVVVDAERAVASMEIVGFTADTVMLRLVERLAADTESPIRLTLAVCLLKSDKMDFVVQKAVELGAAKVQPLESENCVARYDGKKAEARRERWQRIATEAAKQSGRGAVPEVAVPADFKDLMKTLEPGWLKIIPYENEDERTLRQVLREYFPEKTGAAEAPKGIYVFIGPEGGFSAKEVETCCENGFIPVTLGKRILRTETAGLAVVACVRYETGD